MCEKYLTLPAVNLTRIPFPERMRADSLIAKIFADNGKLLLYGSGGNGKNMVIAANSVAQTIIFNILLNNKGNSKNTLLPCFLLCNCQTIAATVADNIAGAQAQNIANP